MVGYRHSVPPDKWWDWLGRDRTRDEVDPWDEQHAWLEDEFGWVGEQLAALTGSEDEDEDKDKRTTRLVWYEDDEGELENTVTWGKREKEARIKHKDKRWIYCMEEEGKKIEEWEQEKHKRAMEAAGIIREPIEKKWTKSKILTEDIPYAEGTKEAEKWIEEQMKMLKDDLA